MAWELPVRSRSIFFLVSVTCLAALAWIFGHYSGTLRSGSSDPAHAASQVTVTKEPASVTTRTFDPANPPSDMPPLKEGEIALCEASYISNVNVAGRGTQTDSTHEIADVAHVRVTLQLVVTIWLPQDATPRVAEHEEGHRQIAEYFYKDADKLIAQIAAQHINQRDLVSGADLNAEFNKFLQAQGAAISDEFNQRLNPDPTQDRYDAITDHARNTISTADAISQALKDPSLATTTAPSPSGN